MDLAALLFDVDEPAVSDAEFVSVSVKVDKDVKVDLEDISAIEESIDLWSSERIKNHLISCGIKEDLAAKFEEHGIQGSHLANVGYFEKPEQLAALGITKYGDQIDLLEAIKEMRRHSIPRKETPKTPGENSKQEKSTTQASEEKENYNYDQLTPPSTPSFPQAAATFPKEDEDLEVIKEIRMLMSKSLEGRESTPSPPRLLSLKLAPSPVKQKIPPPKRLVLYQSPTYEKKVLLNLEKGREGEKDVFIADFLAEKLYAHQLDGIRFMWKNVIQEDAGCILAHSMGLGKSIQVIGFVYTLIQQRLLNNVDLPKEVGKRIMVVCPPIVISNWRNEFHKWIPAAYLTIFRIFLASNYSSILSKVQMLEVWNSEGGVLIIGYQMLRELLRQIEEDSDEIIDDEISIINVNKKDNVNQKLLDRLNFLLLEEGPDLIIADEGHQIKNLNSQLSQQVNRFKTKHRVCLTGYPLQNNLIEYYCMIDFVRPGYLVNICRYRSRYVSPIAAGSFKDSTPEQKKSAAQKLIILGKIIEPIVHRLDNGILRKCLRPKSEFIIQLEMSPLQTYLYYKYLDHLESEDKENFMNSIFVKAVVLTRILNHPACLWSWHRAGHTTAKYDDKGRLFSGGFYSVPTPPTHIQKSKRLKRKNADQMTGLDFDLCIEEEEEEELEWSAMDLEWAKELYSENNVNLLQHSHKMQVIVSIMRECKKNGERVLIFSRSLPTLDFIQDVFDEHDITYFRIDGSVPQVRRTVMIDEFTNRPNAPDAFLISTMAGSLGINLTRASRVILVDIGWNPCHDEQAIARVFRFSQERPTFVYRLQTYGTIESKLYNLNIYKQAMSLRVLDHRNIEKHFRKDQMATYFRKPEEPPEWQNITADLTKDPMLQKLVHTHPAIVGASCHISFLEKESNDTIDNAAYIEAEEEVCKEQRRLDYYHHHGSDSILPQFLMDSFEDTYLYNRKVEEAKNANKLERENVLRAYEQHKNEWRQGYERFNKPL